MGSLGFCLMARFELQPWAIGVPQMELVVEVEGGEGGEGDKVNI